MKSKLVDLRGQLDAKRKKMHEVFEQAGDNLDMDKVTVLDGDSAAKAHQIKALNDELADLGRQVDDLAAVEAAQNQWKKRDDGDAVSQDGRVPVGADGGKGKTERASKSLGAAFVESAAFKGRQGPVGPMAVLDVDLKTLMTTSAGWAPETTRGPRVVDYVTRPIQVTDTIPMGMTAQTAIKYMEETTFTNNAAEALEGGAYGEAALVLTERTDPVQKIAVFLPVTDEQLEDVAGIQSYIDNRLTFMLRQRLDRQILIGDGTSPNLSGILDRSGLQTQAKGADPTPDAVYKAMTLVRLSGSGNGGAIPNVAYFHPNDWQQIRLLRTTDGIYIWGSPSEPGMDRIWGLGAVQAEALTEGTGLVGDTNYVELAVKRGIEIQVSNSHSDYFVNGKQAIRADMRAALAVYRAAAFCSVTGI